MVVPVEIHQLLLYVSAEELTIREISPRNRNNQSISILKDWLFIPNILVKTLYMELTAF